MSGSTVLSAVLWVAALAATVWIVVPAIAFALRVGGIRTEILPDVGPPPVAGGDPVFGVRRSELAALGFREVGRTVTSGWFPFPTHWRWRQLETTRWLVSPDGRTYATLYRLVPNEPARVSCLTIFDDGSLVRTSCPGASGAIPQTPMYRRLDLRGLTAGELVAEHERQVAAFARDHDVPARAVTLAEINAADVDAERPLLRASASSSYGMVAAFLPAAFLVLPAVRGQMPAWKAALGICTLAAFYAAVRWIVHGPLLRHNARRGHTEDILGGSSDVAEDGTILAAGPYEAFVRVLAVLAALLSGVWVVALASRFLIILERSGLAGIILQSLLIALAGLLALRAVGRARGKVVLTPRGRRNVAEVWSSVGILNLLLCTHLDWNKGGTFHRALFLVAGLSFIVVAVGARLEKKRGSS